MKYRKLPIAWSVLCGILCLLLMAFWVRSYWWVDCIRIAKSFSIGSLDGELMADASDVGYLNGDPNQSWETSPLGATNFDPLLYRNLGFYYLLPDNGWGMLIPYWFVVLLVGTVAVVPWIRWRFSLRTLLIATTIVALLLGAVIYAVR